MADRYVWNGATGAANGTDWANAYTRLNTALSSSTVENYFVADDHTETAATATTYISPGLEGAPSYIYCVRRVGGTVPPVAADLRTTATVSTTVASSISLQGSIGECYGITFSAGSATSVANINVGSTLLTWRLVNCHLRLNGSATTSRINLGVHGAYTVLENTTVSFGSVSQGVAPGGRVSIRCNGGAFLTGATIPTNLLIPGTLTFQALIEGADLSNIGAGKFLILELTTPSNYLTWKDCKFGAHQVSVNNMPSMGALEIVLIHCDTGDSVFRTEKHNRAGWHKASSTIYRTGGATDGTTPISWEIAPLINARAPFEALPLSFWNETVGSAITVTIQGASTALPTNKDIWIDVEYFGTSGSTLGSRATSGAGVSLLNAATNNPAGSGTWVGGSPVATKFSMSVTITPQEKGPITVYVMARKISTTYYIDPKPAIT